jgi:hypothetical protein
MMLNKSPLKVDEISSHFGALLVEEGTSLENPTLAATWSAFRAFCAEPVQCDEERLLFECDLSISETGHFYVHFARTCYGRQPKGHVWSYEVICDFLFAADEELEEFNCSIEKDELPPVGEDDFEARREFFERVEKRASLWQALLKRQPSRAQIYVGES